VKHSVMSSRHFSSASLRPSLLKTVNWREIEEFPAPPPWRSRLCRGGSPQQLRLLPPRPRQQGAWRDNYFFLATFRLVFLAAVFLAAGFVFALALAFFAMLPS
jgi:hypothetical protein